MVVLIVLFASWIILRAVGFFGVATLSSWHATAPYAMAVMLVFTGFAHFGRMKHDLARMVPPVFPNPMLMIYFTGLLEFLGAAGLLFAKTRYAAAWALVALMIVLFPANIRAAREHLTLRDRPATNLWLRAPMQLLFIAILLWIAH